VRLVGIGNDRVQRFTVVGWPAPRRKDWKADANADDVLLSVCLGRRMGVRTDVTQVEVSIVVEAVQRGEVDISTVGLVHHLCACESIRER
jgi:hypothetical protein